MWQEHVDLGLIVPPLLEKIPTPELAQWARSAGFASIDLDPDADRATVETMTVAGLRPGPMRIRASLADSDPASRAEAVAITRAAMDRAAELGVDTVWTLARNFRNDATQRANFEAGAESLAALVGYASNRGVRIAIENCPFGGQNAICTPETWDALFDRISSDALGICLDPSHCVWQGIDYLRVVRDYRDRITHVHAKDTEIRPEGRYRYGVDGPQLTRPEDQGGWPQLGWWRHRLPGWGDIDWNAFLSALLDSGYAGVVSIEHEDPLWSDDIDAVRRGLALAREYLSRFVPSADPQEALSR